MRALIDAQKLSYMVIYCVKTNTLESLTETLRKSKMLSAQKFIQEP